MNAPASAYPIGTPGQPWGAAEKSLWRSHQSKKRSYADEVLSVIDRLRAKFDVLQYGELDYPPDGRFPLFALGSPNIDLALPWALVTGGVHGYETSGVHGALLFAERDAASYAGKLNLLMAPCVSPWAYERIHRWNPFAVDPNRSFREGGESDEASALMRLIAPLRDKFIVHIDLHETTDTDETEFRPALCARDGKPFEPEGIPDGFYLVDDAAKPQPGFQSAIIAAVEKITHIAPADEKGEIIGSKVVAPGVIDYAFKELGLCAGMTNARYTTTTEVYPDSPRATPEQCNQAQAAAARAARDYALAIR